jgi:hypothetical protein
MRCAAVPDGTLRPVIRTVRTAAALLAVLLTATGCGFLDAMAHPEEQTTSPTTAASTAAAPTTDPDQPKQIVVADLEGAGNEQLVVTVGHVVTGAVLPFHEFFEDCPVDGPTMQYVTVSFELTQNGAVQDGLAAHLTVTPGPATPADVSDVGVFFEPSIGHEDYCTDYPPLPKTDTFWAHGGPQAVTGYVVVPRAVTPATPHGRPEVIPTLQARIDSIRLRDPDTGQETALHPSAVRTGATCPDDPAAFCVPLS